MFSRPYLLTNSYAFIGGPPVPEPNPKEWDTLTAKVFFRGTQAQFNNVFGPGENPPAPVGSYPSLYCVRSKMERIEDGHIWADVEYKGFADSSARDRGIGHAVTTRDTMWPQQSGDTTVYVPASMLKTPFGSPTSDTNPNTSEYWRVRLIDQLATITIRAALIGTVLNPPQPPAVPIQIRAINRPQSFAGLKDPILNSPRGWVLRNYDPGEPIICPRPGGAVGLYLTTSSYEWVPDYGP
jgi:hypothetical protein